jgi:basic membrane protein A and related proteins
MRRSLLVAVSLLVLLSMVLAGCAKATPTPAPKLKVGEITDTGGIDDKTFNATAYKGIERAVTELGVAGGYLESNQPTDYAKNITEYLNQKYDLIVTVGYLLGEDTATFAKANPNQKFAIVDYAYDPVIPNVLALTFSTDQAAFMAGYLAAGMTKSGKVGTFGGMEIPTVTVFMVGFANGVAYYNQKNGTSVEVLGTTTYVGNFESTDDGRRTGESLMDEGADIIMAVAGPVGMGTAAAVLERGMTMIGVDTDMTVSAPQYKSILLTSVLKNMDVAVYDAIKAVKDGTFKGGTYVGTLVNNGVGLAPYNDFESKVPQALKDQVAQLQKDLIASTVKTGWPLAQ